MAFGRGRKAVGLLAGLALVAGAAACGGSGNDSAAGGNKITIATVAADSGAQGFLAKEKGFYKAQGLEVEVQIVAGVPELAAAVQSGKAQFALTSPTSVAGASASGIPFRVVAGGVKYTKNAELPGDRAGAGERPGPGRCRRVAVHRPAGGRQDRAPARQPVRRGEQR
jgi:ABC-type nitrate/sulfonate/bicarbonate transport system substrate-binding protein